MRTASLFPRLLATSVAVAATAALGSAATVPAVDSAQYQRLEKPPWQPPAQAFPIVWTGLYAVIAGASATALTSLARQRARAEAREALRVSVQSPRAARSERLRRRSRRLRIALGVNLALNAGWCWTFFRAQERDLAVLNAAALTLSSADLARRAGAARRGAGAALAPYAAWCGFATALSASIARRNPQV